MKRLKIKKIAIDVKDGEYNGFVHIMNGGDISVWGDAHTVDDALVKAVKLAKAKAAHKSLIANPIFEIPYGNICGAVTKAKTLGDFEEIGYKIKLESLETKTQVQVYLPEWMIR